MKQVEIRIRFPEAGAAAELEVMTPLDAYPDAQMWDVLGRSGFAAWSPYVLRTDQRVIARAKLTESDGSRVSQERAGQVLDALRTALVTSAGSAGDDRRSGLYRLDLGPRAAGWLNQAVG